MAIRSRQVKGSEPPEDNIPTHAGKEGGYKRETGCDSKFGKRGGGDPGNQIGSLQFDDACHDITQEGPMPEQHTSKDH